MVSFGHAKFTFFSALTLCLDLYSLKTFLHKYTYNLMAMYICCLLYIDVCDIERIEKVKLDETVRSN